MIGDFDDPLAPAIDGHDGAVNERCARDKGVPGKIRPVRLAINFDFDEEVIEALEHGVALTIDVIILIKQKRKWLWDKTINKDILTYKLEYHPLSKHYLVTDMTAGNRTQLQSLTNSLQLMGNINNHILIKYDKLENNTSYMGFIKAKLNIEDLPAPLRPIAIISTKWRLESAWHKWLIK